MTSKFIWQIADSWAIERVNKDNNKLFANSKATAEYCVIGNSQMLETDTVQMICSINGNEYPKLLVYYAETSENAIVLDDGTRVGCWKITSNGEELVSDTDTYDVMTISFEVKRFSTIDATTLLKSHTTEETTENVYASGTYTPMVETTDAEQIENVLSILEATKQDKTDYSLETISKTVVGAINEINQKEGSIETIVDGFDERITQAQNDATSALTKVGRIQIQDNNNHTFTFTNGEGQTTTIETGANPDNETIILNQNDELKAIGIEDNNGVITPSDVRAKQNSTDNALTTTDKTIVGAINEINAVIPEQASPSNQLADKAFVNSTVGTNTAIFRGTYNLITDLNLPLTATEAQIATALASVISTVTNNDYCYVEVPQSASEPTVIQAYDRYKYSDANNEWAFEFELNNSSFTAEQWASINSGMTASKVSQIDTNTSDIASLQSNAVLLHTDQVIDSNKTIQYGKSIKFSDGTGSNTQITMNGINLRLDGYGAEFAQNIFPKVDSITPDGYDLGKTGAKWKDLYLSGELKDGTNSISIANILGLAVTIEDV